MAGKAPTNPDGQKKRTADNEGVSSSANQQPATNHDQKAKSSMGENANEPSTNEETVEEEEAAVAEEGGIAKEDDGPEEQVEEIDDEEDVKDDPAAGAGESAPHALRRKVIKRLPMEYDLEHMYPEVSILVERKRREWNFNDPDLIRALWLEAKTNVLAEWKVAHATLTKRKKPLLNVQENNAFKLRRQHLETQKERLQNEQIEEERRMYSRKQPEFAEVKLATNLTTQIRYNYTRNNPPVPHYFLTHYEKFKRPPFLNYGVGSNGCRLSRRPSR